MPAKSARQQRFMGRELARKRAGKKTKTGMNESQLEEYAGTKRGNAKRGRARGKIRSY